MKAFIPEDKNSYSNMYQKLHTEIPGGVVLVSREFPLISNLSVIENIILPSSYHKKSKIESYITQVSKNLEELGFLRKIYSRKNELTTFEDFCTRILQAIYADFPKIVVFGELGKYPNNELSLLFEFLSKEKHENILFIEYNPMMSFFEEMNVDIIKKGEEWLTPYLKI